MYMINVNNNYYYYEARAKKNIFSLSSPPYIFKIVRSAHVALKEKDDWSWSSFDFIKRGVAHLQIKTKCNGWQLTFLTSRLNIAISSSWGCSLLSNCSQPLFHQKLAHRLRKNTKLCSISEKDGPQKSILFP